MPATAAEDDLQSRKKRDVCERGTSEEILQMM